MKRRVNRSGNDDADVNMTPMLDIVFIMLIFFIVTATFLDVKGVDLTQPPPPPPDSNPPPDARSISVYVDGKNRCSVDGRRTDCDRTVLGVERVLADKPGASIILKVHAKASSGIMIELNDGFNAKSLQTKLEIIPG